MLGEGWRDGKPIVHQCLELLFIGRPKERMNNRKPAAGGAKTLSVSGGKSDEARNADGYGNQYAFSQGCSYVRQCLRLPAFAGKLQMD